MDYVREHAICIGYNFLVLPEGTSVLGVVGSSGASPARLVAVEHSPTTTTKIRRFVGLRSGEALETNGGRCQFNWIGSILQDGESFTWFEVLDV
jgi:hypothetical protein